MLQDRLPSRIVGTRFGIFAVLGLVWLAIEPATALAQIERYELGRRLREFEDRFVTLGLPYRVIGGPRFYGRRWR